MTVRIDDVAAPILDWSEEDIRLVLAIDDVAAPILDWSDMDVRLFLARMVKDEKLLRRWEIRKRARARKRRRGWR